MKAKVAIAKLVYGRRYQWEVEEGWGKVCWLDVQDRTGEVQESTWSRQVEGLAQEYEIELECLSLKAWGDM